MNPVPNRLPKRSSQFGVGKDIGGAVYVHRDYDQRLGEAIGAAKVELPEAFDYHVVNYNYRTGAISFVQLAERVTGRRLSNHV